MTDLDITPLELDSPVAPEMNVYFFFKELAKGVESADPMPSCSTKS